MPSSRIASRIADLLSDAREARDAGDWKTASSLLDAVNALDPGNAEAATMLAGAATRRQMTLLFCDVVGSTEIADQRDPEEVTAIIEQYRAACVEAVTEFDGYIDDHRGDGMLVLFGYPQVDEDDARRGVLCGLQMIERVQRLSVAGLPGSRLHVRISVHTDLVVVADGITGSTANECARIQALAAPDTLVISDTTQDLVWPWFETRVSRPPVAARRLASDRSVHRQGRPAGSARPDLARSGQPVRQPGRGIRQDGLAGASPLAVRGRQR